MVCLCLPDGKVTSDPIEMRKHAVDFYTELFRADSCPEDQASLNADITLDELNTAVSQMASGKAPGIDGLPSDFYKHFWSFLGHDLLGDRFEKGTLPGSCRCTVLSLLPKKGDLTLLKNWRPVALLSTDYKILSKVLSNRL